MNQYTGRMRKLRLIKNVRREIGCELPIALNKGNAIRNPLNTKKRSTPVHPNELIVASQLGSPLLNMV